jgi:hypothetical protein
VDRPDSESYKDDFTLWSNRMERILKRGIKTLAILLVLLQLVLQFPGVRHRLTTTDGPEGVPFHVVSDEP